MNNDTHLTDYYAERATEYDAIYHKPERQEDIKLLSKLLSDLLQERRILEVACGTGFWTRYLATRSKTITATDYNETVLAIARDRLVNLNNVQVQQADAFSLDNVTGEFNAGLAAFWWSHLTKTQIDLFLKPFHAKLLPGSLVVIIDSLYVEGSNTPISRTDSEGNTYQKRILADGREFEVLKNFTSQAEFCEQVSAYGNNIQFQKLTYFWCGWYQIQ